MSILDGILGNGGSDHQSSATDVAVGTDPQFGANLSDVLDFTSSNNGSNGGDSGSNSGGDFTHLTGIGDASVGFAAPTFIGLSTWQQSSDNSNSSNSGSSDHNGDNGGLLNGLL